MEKPQINAQACMFTYRNNQKMGLQVENITKEAAYKTM